MMKRVIPLLVLLCAGVSPRASAEVPDEPFGAVKAIIGRLAGGYDGALETGADRAKASTALAKFVFVEDARLRPGTAKVEAADGRIRISAPDASGASFGLGQYLRRTAKMHISWCGNRVTDDFPLPSEATLYAPAVPVRFAYNYCTLSYTMAFWSAAEWRAEIDRLALSGYNVALVLQGLQEVWRLTLEAVRTAEGARVYSDERIMRYVADEAAQAWWHMGNLEGLGGPVGGGLGAGAFARFKAHTAADAALGRFIYAEMMKLGIQPSIQSFVGLVPDGSNRTLAKGVYEERGVTRTFADDPRWGVFEQGQWQGYQRPDIVNPLSAAFDALSKAWYGALVTVYEPEKNGYTRYMGGDLFHEGGNTGRLTDADLAAIARKIQKTQNDFFGCGDPDRVTWVVQSWQGTPRQGIRNGLDAKKTLIQFLDKDMSKRGVVTVDYRNETTGEPLPWIWAELLNFGGNTGLYGGARRFANLPKIGAAEGETAFRGYGLLSEGLETNPMMYDLFHDAFTRPVGLTSSLDTEAKLRDWTRGYLARRYGEAKVSAELERAAEILLKTVFDCARYQEGCVENVLCAGPSYSVDKVSKWGPITGFEHNPHQVHEAALAYLTAAKNDPELLGLETFRYDFVDLYLQVLSECARLINTDCATSPKRRAQFLKLLDFAERLTACSPMWRLDWHESRTTAVCPVDAKGRSAGIRGYRRMATSWTDGYTAGQVSGLRDYAHRGYSGLFKDYYAKRWQWYFALTEGKISAMKYLRNLIELDATFAKATLKPTPPGDLMAIADEIVEFLRGMRFRWTVHNPRAF